MKSATEDVVAIYAKMDAEAAAAESAAMEDPVAVAILIKLTPRAASGILGEMDAEKAATAHEPDGGAAGAEKKS